MITPESAIWRAEVASKEVALIRGIYVDVTGDLHAGIVLGQIVFWHKADKNGFSKMTVTREGQEWVVIRHEGWWSQCRLTGRQYRRAEKILLHKGIIQTAIFRYRGVPTTHVWLDENRLEELLSHLPKRTNQICTKGTNPNCTKSTNHIVVETSKETMKTTSKQNSQDVLKKLGEGKMLPDQVTLKNKGGSDLVRWYQKLVKLNFEGVGFAGTPSQLEIGLCNNFVSKLGKKDAYPVLRYAIENWTEFAYQVKLVAGASCPIKPALMVLVKFSHIAHDLWQNSVPVEKAVETKAGIVLSKEQVLKY